MLWYLQLTDSIGRWYTTKSVFKVLLMGMKKPVYMNRWNYFKSFVRVCYKGFKKNKPVIFRKIKPIK